jgi:succinate dehydrogenase / fumarate reductase membrane anchor subunit
MSDMETPIARVRGHGSAEAGAHHWWQERLSSLSTFLLFIWFGVSLLRLPDLGYESVTAWLATPLAAVPMLLLIISTFWHLKLGLQVVIEDYVHEEGSRFFWIVLINFGAILGAAFAVFAILRIALGIPHV